MTADSRRCTPQLLERAVLPVLLLVASFASPTAAAEPAAALPDWFEGNRVQAHFENAIHDDLKGLSVDQGVLPASQKGLYCELHPAIRSMGAEVLTRIFKTTEEGAWWPTAAGYTHEAIGGRDLGREIASHAHAHGLKVIAYYRIMCDDFVEQEHPEWLCRDLDGNLVLEPRTRSRQDPQDRKHVVCFNSPARELVETRLLELADRGVDGIYFDSWHMPEVCACENCKAAYKEETGRSMDPSAQRGSEAYLAMTEFVGRTIVGNFRHWKQAVQKKYPGVIFAISSSLYPCFHTQMQITGPLLQISDTSKTEFHKPFGGFVGRPFAATDSKRRPQPFMDESFALPDYDVQNALGWSFTRDSCDGRPTLMWIPFTRTEPEALYSAAAAVSYGCVASIHPWGLWERRSNSIRPAAAEIYKSSYAMGRRVSPHLASARPFRFALIHISEHSRNLRIADPRALWVELFAPILGAFETLKEEHLPVCTINDNQLEQGIPPETRLVILPRESDCTGAQRTVLRRFQSAGGVVLGLENDRGWHLEAEKPKRKQELAAKINAAVATPPMRARGPVAMHAVFFQNPPSRKTVVCFVNRFGWFRSQRDVSDADRQWTAPPPCRQVELEIADPQRSIVRAFEALTGKDLTVDYQNARATVRLPEFPVMACAVLERRPSD